MEVKLIKYPSKEDWILCKRCALVTVGKDSITEPTQQWKHDILEARHSPIRELPFVFELEIPYWVSVHLVRHVHAQPYVKSNRNDRQSDFDRTKAPQDVPVRMIWSMEAEELMIIANKRLCKMAAEDTRKVVQMMRDEVLKVCPEFEDLLVPMCVYHGGVCHEMFGCKAKKSA